MSFNPSSTIYLCNVPIDNTYKHQIFFGTATRQRSYFSSHVVKTFANYLTVRKTLPNGSTQSSVKVSANIDDLYNCNYMYYQNANHGTRWFYAFITNLIYINEGTTEIVFETDVYQTWLFDVELLESYVVREHSTIDVPGSNIVPESFNFQDYFYELIKEDDTLSKWGYLVGTTEHNFDDSWLEGILGDLFGGEVGGKLMSGIYQGLYFFYFDTEAKLNTFLSDIKQDSVVFICAIPEFCISENDIETDDRGFGWLYRSTQPAETDINMRFSLDDISFDGYYPVNKKLYTSPFIKMIVSNHAGQQAEYLLEDFNNSSNIHFTLYGDVSANPSVTLVPNNYKGLGYNFDAGITLSGFPQVSFNSDTFKLWLTKNQFGVALDTVGNIAQIMGGLAMGVGSGGVAGAIGGSQVISGVQGILSTVNSVYQASVEPNKANTGSAKNNLLTAMGLNKFDFYLQTIKKSHAVTIDKFFTMYGYQTNRLKVPNVSARPCWNYVQTIDCNISGGIPADDMRTLKAMYNNGVTLWNSGAVFGDYSQDNSILI